MADALARRCTVEADGKRCDRPAKARGMCKTHWLRWRKTGEPGSPEIRQVRSPEATCSFQDCDRPHAAVGLCNTHYDQQQRRGHLLPIRKTRSSRRISENEMAILADLSIPRAEVAGNLGLAPGTVSLLRRKIKYHVLERSDWTDDEIDFIIENINAMKTSDIARRLGRSTYEVQVEINRLRTNGFVPKRATGRTDPWCVGDRPLIAKTCPSCGNLLGVEFFLTVGRRGKKYFRTECRICANRRAVGLTSEVREKRNTLARRAESRMQAYTADRAESRGHEWTTADVQVLADSGKTTFEKAIELKRTYYATANALRAHGLTSKPDAIPSPEDSAWRIFWDMEVPEGEVSHA